MTNTTVVYSTATVQSVASLYTYVYGQLSLAYFSKRTYARYYSELEAIFYASKIGNLESTERQLLDLNKRIRKGYNARNNKR